MMQVREDTQVTGRFFPRGSRVRVIEVDDGCLVLPDSDARTTMCAVPTKSLAPLTLLCVVLVNHHIGLMGEQERGGLDADGVCSSIAESAPDCRILKLDRVVS